MCVYVCVCVYGGDIIHNLNNTVFCCSSEKKQGQGKALAHSHTHKSLVSQHSFDFVTQARTQ